MPSTSVGEVIAQRYELLEVIGHGGQGQVFRSRDLQSGRDVAVKVIEGRAARSADTIERLAREQQAMIALAGTAAVEFLDMCSSDSGALCLVMELLEGQDFESYLVQSENRGEPLSVNRLMDVVEPVVTTLDRAHAVGILHRDLKPGNIFLLSKERGGGSRLLDFGFARLSDSKRVTATGMVMGSPSYIAPEMWKGQGKSADHRVDIYALGVIIFRALAGQLPFSNRSMQETLIAVTTAPRPSLHALRPDLPPEVDEWVNQVLAVNIDDRFSSMRQTWDHLLWRLGSGPVPGSQTGATIPTDELDKIRLWLLEPPSDRHGSAQGVWATAAATLKRLIGRSAPSPRRSEPSRLIEVEPIKTLPPPHRPKAPLPAPRPTAPPIKTSPPPLPPQRKSAESGSLPAPKLRPMSTHKVAAASELPPDLMRARTAPPRPPRPIEEVEAQSVPPTTRGTRDETEQDSNATAPMPEGAGDASLAVSSEVAGVSDASAASDHPTTVANTATAAAPVAASQSKRAKDPKRKARARQPARSGELPSPASGLARPSDTPRPGASAAAASPKRAKPKWKSRRHRKSK